MGVYENRLIKYYRGSIWMCNLSQIKVASGVQSGNRPVVIISSNIGNVTNSSVLVALITSNTEKSKHSINIPFINCEGECNVILGNQLHTVNKSALTFYMGTIPDSVMKNVANAVNIALGIQQKEATINEVDKVVSRIVEAYNRKIEIDKEIEVFNQSKINSIAEKLEELFTSVIIPLEKGKEHAPLLASYCKSGEENSNESPKIFQEKEEAIEYKKKSRGFWTDERKAEYMQDKENMTLQELTTKWDMQSTKTAYQMYYQFKRQLNK